MSWRTPDCFASVSSATGELLTPEWTRTRAEKDPSNHFDFTSQPEEAEEEEEEEEGGGGVTEPREPLMSSKPPKCFYVNIFFKHERETSRAVNKT